MPCDLSPSQVDPEGFGEVLAVDFLRAMSSAEFVERVDVGKRVQLADRVRSGDLEVVTYQEFVNVVSTPLLEQC